VVINLQIVKSLIEGISQRDRKTYKLGRIMTVNAPVIGGRKADIILPDDVNVHQTSENIRNYLDSKFNKGTKKVNVTYFSSGPKKEISINNIVLNVKTETRTDYNLGNVAEGVFAAAIACRFVNKETPITSNDVYDMIDKMHSSGKTPIAGRKSFSTTVNLKSQNKGISIEDDVKLYVELASANIDFLFGSRENKKDLDGYVKGAVKYANNQKVSRWAKLIYLNGRYDKIEIEAKGVASKNTKVDIDVKLTDHKGKLRNIDIKASLKSDDVKQFGQKGGVKFDSIKEFFSELFDINIDILKTKYEKLLIEDKKTDQAFVLVYSEIRDRLNDLIKTDRTKKSLFEKLGKGIKYYATLNEDNVELVQIGSGDVRIYNFKNLPDLMSQYDFYVEYDTYSSGDDQTLPVITINEKLTRKKLITIRSKYEQKSNGEIYYRQYLEKEQFLSELISRAA
jgi:hypothetical protein